MKKLVMTVLTVLACGAVYALPAGNPAEASLLCTGFFWDGDCCGPCNPMVFDSWCDGISVRVGYYGNFVFNRHMKVNTNEDCSVVEHSRLNTNAGVVYLNLWERLDVYGVFGATHIYLEGNASIFGGTSGNRVEVETETDFGWGVGIQATIWECGCTTLGFGFEYFYSRPDITRVTVAATNSEYPDGFANVKYEEWEFSVGVAHRINMLVPYAAINWGNAKMKMDDTLLSSLNDLVLHDLENQKEWSYAVGVSLIDCEKASITVEGRYSGEKALYVNGQVRL